jgi:hypothetical protein
VKFFNSPFLAFLYRPFESLFLNDLSELAIFISSYSLSTSYSPIHILRQSAMSAEGLNPSSEWDRVWPLGNNYQARLYSIFNLNLKKLKI